MERTTTAPAVSVVIPLFNCLRLTQAMLESLDATWPGDLTRELIFVDDGSTDETRRWLASLSVRTDVRVVLNERNLGYAASNNRGAAVARGRLLVLLNNDLVLLPRWLEPLLKIHAKLGAEAGAIGNVQYSVANGRIDHAGIQFDAKGKPEHIRELPLGSNSTWSVRRWRRVDAVTGACLLIDRELWGQLGGFDEGYVNGCEDVDLCLRASASGRTNAISLCSRVLHHVSSSPGRKRRDEMNTLRLTLRWRERIVFLAARRWCAHYLACEWTHPRNPDSAKAAAAALSYVLHLQSKPPAVAIAGLTAAIDHEVARWNAIVT